MEFVKVPGGEFVEAGELEERCRQLGEALRREHASYMEAAREKARANAARYELAAELKRLGVSSVTVGRLGGMSQSAAHRLMNGVHQRKR